MAKQSGLEKAIAALDQEIAVLQLARGKLVEQLSAKPKQNRKPRALKTVESQSA